MKKIVLFLLLAVLTFGQGVQRWDEATGTWVAAFPQGNAVNPDAIPISAQPPVTNDALIFDGAYWVPKTLSSVMATGGDLSGNLNAAVVAKIRGVSVSSSTPEEDQVLQFNGSTWAPATLVTDPGLSGDLSGTASAAVVTKLQGIGVSTQDPTSSQLMQFDGSNWTPADDVRQISYVITDPATELTTTTGSVATVFSNRFGRSMTILEVFCQSDQASASTFNISISGSNVFSSAQNCTSTGNSYTSFNTSTIANSNTVSHSLASVAADTKRTSVTLRYKLN